MHSFGQYLLIYSKSKLDSLNDSIIHNMSRWFNSKREDLASFNEIAVEIVKKSSCVLNPEDLKLYDAEIDIMSNSLVPFQRGTNPSQLSSKDWIISDVCFVFVVIL